MQTQFVTASQAGTGPDLVMGAHDWIGNPVQNGAIDPVPMTDTTKASFLGQAIQGVTFNGQIYGMPYAVEDVFPLYSLAGGSVFGKNRWRTVRPKAAGTRYPEAAAAMAKIAALGETGQNVLKRSVSG